MACTGDATDRCEYLKGRPNGHQGIKSGAESLWGLRSLRAPTRIGNESGGNTKQLRNVFGVGFDDSNRDRYRCGTASDRATIQYEIKGWWRPWRASFEGHPAGTNKADPRLPLETCNRYCEWSQEGHIYIQPCWWWRRPGHNNGGNDRRDSVDTRNTTKHDVETPKINPQYNVWTTGNSVPRVKAPNAKNKEKTRAIPECYIVPMEESPDQNEELRMCEKSRHRLETTKIIQKRQRSK